ncbi:MAG: nucleotidyltransferase family protein [Elainellaceae cyanobacterium]
MSSPTPDALQPYVAHFRQRQERERRQQQYRYQQGWEQARIAAKILKATYGVRHVFLFGSLLSPEAVHPSSDIDLAVWGLPLEHYSDAVGTLLLTVKGFSVDIVRLETAQPSLKRSILQAGVEL